MRATLRQAVEATKSQNVCLTVYRPVESAVSRAMGSAAHSAIYEAASGTPDT